MMNAKSDVTQASAHVFSPPRAPRGTLLPLSCEAGWVGWRAGTRVPGVGAAFSAACGCCVVALLVGPVSTGLLRCVRATPLGALPLITMSTLGPFGRCLQNQPGGTLFVTRCSVPFQRPKEHAMWAT